MNAAIDLLRAMRPHQWTKNALLAVPLVVGHQIQHVDKSIALLFAVITFSLCCSAIYIINDLLDVDADRRHPTKRKRPFAAGRLRPVTGMVTATALLLVSALLAGLTLPRGYLVALTLYAMIAIAYSLFIKRQPILDVIVLAGLYTHRIIAGGIAVSVIPSSWLLAFSLFFFLSLAFVKRYSELDMIKQAGAKEANARGYIVDDLELTCTAGLNSGYLAVLVFCLYINSPDVQKLYSHPAVLWLICPVLLYWITRIWCLAKRQAPVDDPVLFALTDRVSYVTGLLIGLLLIVAAA